MSSSFSSIDPHLGSEEDFPILEKEKDGVTDLQLCSRGTKQPECQKDSKTEQTISASAETRPRVLNINQGPLSRRICGGISKRDDFPLEVERCALVIIDVQEYLSTSNSYGNDPKYEHFFQVSLPQALHNIELLVKQCRSIREEYSWQSWSKPEIAFVYLEALTLDGRDLSLDYKLSGPLLANLPNPRNPAVFLPNLWPLENELAIRKTSCSVFKSTNIDYVLRNCHVEQLILCGQITNQCVESACRDAADLGYLVTVACDACAAFSPSDHEFGLKNMKGFARILTTEQVLHELSNPQPLESLKANSSSLPRDDPAALPIAPLTTAQVSVSDEQFAATTTQASDPAAIPKASDPAAIPKSL